MVFGTKGRGFESLRVYSAANCLALVHRHRCRCSAVAFRLGPIMKFSAATLPLVTAFVAIVCAACIGWWKVIDPVPDEDLGFAAFLMSALSLTAHAPLWLPIAFAAYAIGGRTFSLRLVLLFAVAECGPRLLIAPKSPL